MNTQELRKAAKCIFIVVEEKIAQNIADKLNGAAHEIDRLNIQEYKNGRRHKSWSEENNNE